MKGFLVFLTVALVASTASAGFVRTSLTKENNRGAIEDALNTVKCLRATVAGVEASIEQLSGTVANLNRIVSTNIEKLNACLAIGGSNPSIIDQILSAQCAVDLSNSFKGEITGLINQINADVANLVSTGDKISACF